MLSNVALRWSVLPCRPRCCIDGHAFDSCSSLQDINLPEGLQVINLDAFVNCASLRGISLPSTLETLGEGAFSGCASLTSVSIPEGIRNISSYAFYNCTSLESVTMAEGTEAIYGLAFYGCTSLERIAFPSTLRSISDHAFYDCASLRSIVFPPALQSISDFAFYNCASLRNVTCLAATPPDVPKGAFYGMADGCSLYVAPDAASTYADGPEWGSMFSSIGLFAWDVTYRLDGQSITVTGPVGDLESIAVPSALEWEGEAYLVTAIDSEAFEGCTSLVSIALPESLQTIRESAFADCMALERISFGEGVTLIEQQAFAGCTSLAGITLPKGLQVLGESAFEGCTALADVILPNTMRTIGLHAFSGCPLRNITSLAAVPPVIASDETGIESAFDTETYATALLHVPANAARNYQAADWWTYFLSITEDAAEIVSIEDVATDASIATYADGIVTTATPATITVYAQSGAVVRYAEGATSLDLNALPRGIYIIGIEADGQRQVLKVVR